MMLIGPQKFEIVNGIDNHTLVLIHKRAIVAGGGEGSMIRLSIKIASLAFIGFID